MNARKKMFFVFAVLLTMTATGCARSKEMERINSEQSAKISSLNDEIANLNKQLEALSKAKNDLTKTQEDLEKKLRSELMGGDVSLSMQDRGLVLTVSDKVLFDSGKDSLKNSAESTLGKLADIINKDTKENLIYVEGHTDNVPIHYSSWKSNWELSTARSTGVIHYLAESAGVDPKRLVASGYGEYHPLTSNESNAGRQMNRRVEIVISPKKYTDRKMVAAPKDQPVTAVAVVGGEVIK